MPTSFAAASSTRDHRRAAALCVAGAALLLVTAFLGLNTWPGQELLVALGHADAAAAFDALRGFSVPLAALFWASRPNAAAQRAVLAAWVLLVPLAAAGLSGTQHPWPSVVADPFFWSTCLAVPCTFALAWRAARPSTGDAEFEQRLRALMVVFVLFPALAGPALELTARLHPVIFDAYALHVDRAAHLDFTPALVRAVAAVPGLARLAEVSYMFTPFVFMLVALSHLRHRPSGVATAAWVWVVLSCFALTAYHAFPITGPAFLFGSEHFVDAIAGRIPVPVSTAELHAPYPRNGMPSMHFGWLLAATLLWWQTHRGPAGRAALVAVTLLTATATLYFGQHYVIDLVVAVPFVLGILALCSGEMPWRGSRAACALLGFAAWAAWVLALRFGVTVLVEAPGAAVAMVAATAAIVVLQSLLLRRAARDGRSVAAAFAA